MEEIKMKALENRRTNKIVNQVNYLKDKCIKNHVIDMRPHLDRISMVAQEPLVKMTHRKYVLIKKCLNNISNNLNSSHETLIKFECEKACKVATGKYVAPTKEEEQIMKNYADINDLQKIIKDTDAQINENKAKMDACLGKDPTQWKMLSAMNANLRQKKALFERQFNDSLTFCQNLEACNNAKTIRSRYTDNIIKNQGSVNLENFDRDIDTINCVGEEVKNQNEVISQRIYDSYDSTLDDEYMKALSEKNEAKVESTNFEPSNLNTNKELKITNM